jgi:hypothetical protein
VTLTACHQYFEQVINVTVTCCQTPHQNRAAVCCGLSCDEILFVKYLTDNTLFSFNRVCLTWSSAASSGTYCRILSWMSTYNMVDFQWKTRQFIPEDAELHTRRRENLKSHIINLYGEATLYLSLIALMMEAVRTSETPVDIQLRTRKYIPEDAELHTRRRENLKSHICLTCLTRLYNLHRL